MPALSYSRRPRFGREWIDVLLRVVTVALLLAAIVAAFRVLMELGKPAPETRAPRSTEERILADARAAVDQDPKNATARWQLSLALSTVGDHKEALVQGEQAARLAPKQAEPFYALGVAYRGLGDRGRAVKALTKAVSIPNSVSDIYREVYFELGELRVEEGAYKKAIVAFEQALANGPEATYVVIGLAGAYRKAGDNRRAIREYLAVLGYDPGNEEAAKALRELGVSDEQMEKARNPVAHQSPGEKARSKP